MGKLTVVVGGQFGSEGKGAVTGHLASLLEYPQDMVIRVAGPNAGHTAYDDSGREWKLRQVPVAAVTNRNCRLGIAAGSEVDLDVLRQEINELETAGHKVLQRLYIHPQATVIEQGDLDSEAHAELSRRVGSTGKGIGAARARRIMRDATTIGDWDKSVEHLGLPIGWPTGSHGDITQGRDVIIEGTQGYGLGLHTPFYPQVTSSDCRAIDFLAMAGVSPWAWGVDGFEVVVVARMFPIRVAGNSGPLERETTWAELGLPEEHTTVTNKVRRVGGWDPLLVAAAVEANGGGPRVKLALTMLDQAYPDAKLASIEDDLPHDAWEAVQTIEEQVGARIKYIGTSPTTIITRSV